MPKPNPDDRSDNVERLQEHIENTYENLDDAEDFLAAHDEEMRSEQEEPIRAKNRRRREAIEGYRDEIEDEAHRDE